jgi:phosphate transport system substrate-binding protein
MSRPAPIRRTAVALLVAAAVALGVTMVVPPSPVVPTPAAAAPAAINGQGSSYVALAMQQWVADAQTKGLRINYLPTGSPQGLTSFAQNLVDFAGTEAEFSSLSVGSDPARGYQYVPSTAGAVAIQYNVVDSAGRKVDYLRLSRSTVAKIFMGYISRWSDPAISADNKGLVLPDQPINVVYRGGLSGTTALFYDFVKETEPELFQAWAARNSFRTDVRIIQLDSSPGFAPKTQAFNGSDQIAQFIASGAGLWSIGYNEFGYSKVYGTPSAFIQNAAGQWVLPFAQNISAALESARLRPDLSQELDGVYKSTNPQAYPISAYSYIVTQCSPAPDRATCKGNYTNPGVAETLTQWLRYIACEGQITMADIGYSPLPPNLSQEVVNSIARMNGTTPETLTADNCPNPRFRGQIGGASPPDPLAGVDSLAPGAEGGAGPAGGGVVGPGGGGRGGSGGGAGSDGESSEVAAGAVGAAGAAGAVRSAGGGSGSWQDASPVLYDRPGPSVPTLWPVLLLLAVVLVPPLLFGRRVRGVRVRPSGDQALPPPPAPPR